MKTTNAFKLLVLFVSVIFVGCSSDDSSGEEGGDGGEQLTSISVSAVRSTIDFGSSFTFSVTGNNGKDLTDESTISVNDSTLDGNTYVPTVIGTFNVTAEYQDMVSEAIEVTVSSNAPLALTMNGSKIDITENFVFNVEYEYQEITSNSTIYFDDEAIQSNIVETPQAGNHDVYATYENDLGVTVSSDTLTVEVVDRTSFTQNVLIEDYTGTWCGWCPRVARGIELVEQQTDKAVVVAIHRGNTNPSSGAYDPYNFNAGVLENLINLQGYPTAMLNRMTLWKYPEPNNVNQAVNLTGDDADLGLKINSTLEGNNLDIAVDVKFGTDYSSETLQLVVYVLEDGLIFDQVNYTNFYGGADILNNFMHDNVLRKSVTDILGDDIPPAETSAINIYTQNFNIPVPANVEDKNNLSIVAFVVNSNNIALNSRKEVVGEAQIF